LAGLKEAESRLQASDPEGAIRAYEMLLDGTQKTAEAHYRLGHLYAEKLKNPMGALHHYARYLSIAPEGPFAKDARAYQKEGELMVIHQLGKGAPITQEEAARIKNENLTLRKNLAELRAIKTPPPVPPTGAPGTAGTPKLAKGEVLQKPIPPGAKTYTVAPGDTLASIAQKVYKNKARWKEIQDANFYTAEGVKNLKPGQELVIP
jgi:nucleoid-associated protein YgaU